MTGPFGPRLSAVLKSYDILRTDPRDNAATLPEPERLRALYARCVNGKVCDLSGPLTAAAESRRPQASETDARSVGEILSNMPNFPFP